VAEIKTRIMCTSQKDCHSVVFLDDYCHGVVGVSERKWACFLERNMQSPDSYSIWYFLPKDES
jgi:hypothetical protein